MSRLVLCMCLLVADVAYRLGFYKRGAWGSAWYALPLYAKFYPRRARKLGLIWFPYC